MLSFVLCRETPKGEVRYEIEDMLVRVKERDPVTPSVFREEQFIFVSEEEALATARRWIEERIAQEGYQLEPAEGSREGI